MNSTILAISGSHEACYRFLVDTQNGDKTIIINSIGIDSAISELESMGFNFNQILDYTVC